jgi:hypothetical protein
VQLSWPVEPTASPFDLARVPLALARTLGTANFVFAMGISNDANTQKQHCKHNPCD